MYINNSDIRLVTINEDGSAEILYKNQTFTDIPKERVEIKLQTDNEYRLDEILKAIKSLEKIANNLEWGGDLSLSKEITDNTEIIKHHTVRLKMR